MKAAEWNAKYPVGTKVRYFPLVKDLDTFIDTTTRTEAWELGHGEAVVSLKGMTSGMAVSHITVLEPAKAELETG